MRPQMWLRVGTRIDAPTESVPWQQQPLHRRKGAVALALRRGPLLAVLLPTALLLKRVRDLYATNLFGGCGFKPVEYGLEFGRQRGRELYPFFCTREMKGQARGMEEKAWGW